MTTDLPTHGLTLTSTLDKSGQLELTLINAPVTEPGPDQVVIHVEATPINPSDLMTLLPAADPHTAVFGGSPERPVVTAQLAANTASGFADRFGQPLTVGLEGAGTVVAAGANAAQLMGQRVAALTMGRGMFGQYCTVQATDCVPLPPGISPARGAGLFCNPMTALAIVETLHQENKSALVHTAAASNLGRMLVRICEEDNIPLVNIVRRREQETLLREMGARYVCNSCADDFDAQFETALRETGATVAFDAVGGGDMPHRLLQAMEKAAVARMSEYSPYGSSEAKTVYVYGRLDKSPVTLDQSGYGMQWNIAGWSMPPVLERAGGERSVQLMQRILENLDSTFASHFAREISLAEVLQKDNMLDYCSQATGRKYLINPQL